MINLTPNASARHWSAEFCNLPWAPGAEGPDAYDCWGLVREVQLTRYGRDLPPLRVAATGAPPGQWGEIRNLVQRGPWKRTMERPRQGDVLTMLNAKAEPHVGVVIELPRLSLLHAVGGLDEHGVPHGSVRIDAIDQLSVLGFGHFEVWRYGT
jgi:hypothetical protein